MSIILINFYLVIDPMNSCHFGKYGALVNLSLSQKNEQYTVNKNNLVIFKI